MAVGAVCDPSESPSVVKIKKLTIIQVQRRESDVLAEVSGATYVLHQMMSKSRHPLMHPDPYLRELTAYISKGFVDDLGQG